MPPRRRDECTFSPEWILRKRRRPAWLKQLAIDFEYTSRLFLVILAVFMLGVTLAPLAWYVLTSPTRKEDLVQIQGRLRSYERREWSEDGSTSVEHLILLEGRPQTFMIPQNEFFAADAFAAGVRRGDLITISIKRKDLESPRRRRIWTYHLSAGGLIYQDAADVLPSERADRKWALVLAAGGFLIDILLGVFVIRDAARRTG